MYLLSRFYSNSSNDNGDDDSINDKTVIVPRSDFTKDRDVFITNRDRDHILNIDVEIVVLHLS